MTDLGKLENINSTEKLLELIRGKGGEQPPSQPEAPPASEPQQHGPQAAPSPPLPVLPFKSIWRPKKKVTVGVDIGSSSLKMMKTAAGIGNNRLLLDYRIVDFDPGLPEDKEKFTGFLKDALGRFCDTDHAEIWSAVSSAVVETRYLRIPKVARRQLSNAVFWTFKKEIAFNEQEHVFDFEVIGEIVENGAKKLEVIALAAPRAAVQDRKALFRKAGFPLTGISIFPFGLQNLFRTQWLATEGKSICSLYIGQNWSRIDILSAGGHLLLSRGIKAGVNSMVEAIREVLKQNQNGSTLYLPDETGPANTGDSFDNLNALSLEVGENGETDDAPDLFFTIAGGADEATTCQGVCLSEADVFQIVLPALERLIRQVERTLDHFSLKFGGQRVNRIYLSGEISMYARLVNQIADQLGIAAQTIDPFLLAPSVQPKPEQVRERLQLTHATGLSLSNNAYTPNFLYTHVNKENAAKYRRLNQIILAVFLVLTVVMGGVKWGQMKVIEQKKEQITRLETRLQQYQPLPDQQIMAELAGKIRGNHQILKGISQKYHSMAILAEISALTPEAIRLLEVSIELARPEEESASEKETGKKVAQAPKSKLTLDGFVTGERQSLETALASYLLRLKNSVMLDQPRVQKKSIETIDEKDTLHFQAYLDIL